MAKANRTDKTAIVKVPGVTGGFLANFQEPDQSLATMTQYVIVPRLKVIQAMTKPELKEKIGPEGTVCVRPGDVVVAGPNEPFPFVPLFFFNHWCKWADINEPNPAQRILEQTYDPTTDLAKRCADPEARLELYPGMEKKPERDRLYYSYVHHFCWAGIIYGDHALAGTQVVLTMERGEWGNGRQFITACSMRRHAPDGSTQKVQVPLWAQVWDMRPSFRDKGTKKWWGLDFAAPAENAPIIKDDEAGFHQQEYLRLAELHEANKLRVDHAEGDETAEPPQDSKKF